MQRRGGLTPLAGLIRPLRLHRAEADVGPGLTLHVSGRRERVTATGRVTSRSTAGAIHGLLVALDGSVGLDVETLGRVALNATAEDDWLTREEKVMVAAASDPLVELACHWVLKEAYGKALGAGLAIPLDRLRFGGCRGAIVLDGPRAPPRADAWTFRLYARGEALFAIAFRPRTSERDAVRARGQEAADAAVRQI